MAQQTERLEIMGGCPLSGRARIPAAKNSVLPLLAASALCREPTRLRNVPRLSDVESSLALLRQAGCSAGWQGGDLVVAGSVQRCALDRQTAGQMRASILFCAPLLARLGRVESFFPGGCSIGTRPIGLHLEGLAQMGVLRQDAGPERLVLVAPSGLHGADITLRYPSVGATETLLLAAVCARGRTVLRGAAREPEIADLAAFLNRCGGRVEGAGTATLRIQGVRGLSGCTFSPMPDRIYASTLACACAAAGGQVELTDCAGQFYAPVLEILEQMGCMVQPDGDTVRLARFGQLYGVGRVLTGPYPGLATDAAPLLGAAMLCAGSESSIEDVVFERRFACAEGFCRLGGQARVDGRILTLRPCTGLRGTALAAADLRGAAALLIAALAARGTSTLTGLEYLERGYAGFAPVLAGLGARIRQQTTSVPPARKKHRSKNRFVLQSEQKDDTILLYSSSNMR